MIIPLFSYENTSDIYERLKDKKYLEDICNLHCNDPMKLENFNIQTQLKQSWIYLASFALYFVPDERIVLASELKTYLNLPEFLEEEKKNLSKLDLILNIAEEDKCTILCENNIVNFPLDKNYSQSDLRLSLSNYFDNLNKVANLMYDFMDIEYKTEYKRQKFVIDFSQI